VADGESVTSPLAAAADDADGAAVVAVLERAVADHLAPGVAAAVVTQRGLRWRWAHGTLTYEPGSFAVDDDTVFDLASVTKLLATARLLARAVDEGVVHLDECPWPRWPGVTVAHALRHDGGLVAHRPFFETARARGVAGLRQGYDVVVDAVFATPPEAAPGARTIYSDLGFIALGDLLQQRRGRRLEDQLVDVVPSGSGLRFVRLADDGYHKALPKVAPTERCPWRRRVVQGQVHDDNAYAMGGVAGHAGLFGSLQDVEAAALTLLHEVQGTGLLSSWAQVPGLRGLGFDKATPGGSTGDVLGPRTVGHLGFTGTSVWLDPDLDGGAVFVLLANTVHPARADVVQRSRALRRAFHGAAAALVRASSSTAPASSTASSPSSVA
jgi:CubicO group peptidase (beta-lactamase class C family)